MLISYQNYNGGINNLCVVTEDFRGNVFSGICGTSTIDEAHAIKNFKRNFKKHTGKKYPYKN